MREILKNREDCLKFDLIKSFVYIEMFALLFRSYEFLIRL